MKVQISLAETILTPLLENTSDAVCVIDKDMRVIVWNSTCEKLFGYSSNEALSKYVYTLIFPSKYSQNYIKDFNKLKQSDHNYLNPINTDRVYITKDGTELNAKLKLFSFTIENKWFAVAMISEVSSIDTISAKLRSTEEKFKLAMESTQDGFFIWDVISSEVYFSPRWKEMLGYQDKEIPNEFAQWVRLTLPEDKEKTLQAFESIFTKRHERFSVEFRMEHKEGRQVNISARGQIFYDAFGQALKVVGTHRDITEQVLTEKNLKMLSEVVKQSPVSIIITTLDAEIVYVNPFFTKVTGYTKEEAMGQTIHEIMKSQTDTTILDKITLTIKNGNIWKGELNSIKKNGYPLIESAIVTPFHDSNGQFSNILVVLEDITQRKEIEIMLTENEQKLLNAQIIAKLGHYTLYIQEGYWVASEELYNIFGIEWKEKQNIDDWINILHPEDRQNTRDYFLTEVIGKHQTFDREYRIINAKDGTVRWVHGIGELSFNHAGEVLTMAGVIQDITERKNLELSLKELNANLQERVNTELEKVRLQENIIHQQKRFVDMGQMINAIAHQWRQPLNNINLIMDTIRSSYNGKKFNDFNIDYYFDTHSKLVHFMSETIDDFRYFFSSNKQKQTFSVSSELQKVTSLLSSQLNSHNINLSLQCHCQDQPEGCNFSDEMTCRLNNDTLYGVSGELRHVFLNIINNAKDAILENSPETQALSKIYLTLIVNDDSLHITIFNTGKQIDESIMIKIFEPYFTTKEEGKGTGIGLFMSKLIIENEFNGRLYSEYIEGGVNFHIIIPKTYEEPAGC